MGKIFDTLKSFEYFSYWDLTAPRVRYSDDFYLYLQQTYSKDDCTFREQVLPDGYSVYRSVSHGALISLGNYRQQQRGEDWSVPTLAQFLPRITSLDQDFKAVLEDTEKPEQVAPQRLEPADMVDSFGKLSQIIHSPSFHKRWSSSETSEPASGMFWIWGQVQGASQQVVNLHFLKARSDQEWNGEDKGQGDANSMMFFSDCVLPPGGLVVENQGSSTYKLW